MFSRYTRIGLPDWYFSRRKVMMIGPIVDSGALFIGGLAGACCSGILPKRIKETLPLIFGVITLCMGMTLVHKVSSLPVVVMALILGTCLGELFFAESFLAACIRALFRMARTRHCGDESFIVNIITLVSAFCFGSMGIFGAINEGITGNTDILFTKAVLDLFSGILFGTLFGFSVSLIAIPQFMILAGLYLSATFIAPYMTAVILGDFTSCGGVIFVATGLRMCGIKIFPVINMLPSMALVMPLSALWARYAL